MSNAEAIVSALGGKTNLVGVEPCITRLRIEVEDPAKVDERALKERGGAFGVVRSGRVVQVVVGPAADDLAEEITKLP